MARDKLITIRIEGEKREAFNQLAKSQNTDTASLLYDFINLCLSGQIDIALVTGKGQRIDKIDNRIDSNRIDKLETTTQQIDDCLSVLAEKLDDCDRALSGKIESLEDRLKALSIQLDSQQNRQEIDTDSQQLDRIDTDSQLDSQQNRQEMEPVKEAIETVPKTHKDIAERLGFKSQTKLNYWIKNGKIPTEYANRCQFNPEKTKILWINP